MYYIDTDQLDTSRLIQDASNTPVWRWDSDPFGATPANDDPPITGRHFKFNLRFPGQHADVEAGLNYNYFRDYDPATGRYIKSDPIGLMGGVNTFWYVKESPIGNLDTIDVKAIYKDKIWTIENSSIDSVKIDLKN